jgi:thymidylate synthase (FAD)
MKVELLNSTPLWVVAKAIRKCWASEDKSDTEICLEVPSEAIMCGDKDKELIHRVGNKNKHSSTLEHLVYTFDIDGISRACLQEVARHRMASYSVKSTRYTLKELKEEVLEVEQEIYEDDTVFVNFNRKIFEKYVVMTGNPYIDGAIALGLKALQSTIKEGHSNDVAKYVLPEAYKTSLVMTINARSLQNFLSLRTSKSALWEIRDLAKNIYDSLPDEHKYLFEDSVNA